MSAYIENGKEIRDNADAVQVIGNYIDLDNKLFAKCPFHEEKTKSFHIYKNESGTQRYKCFGCDASGDSVDFVQKHENVDLVKAFEIVANISNIPIMRKKDIEAIKNEIYEYKAATEDQEEKTYHYKVKEEFDDYDLKVLYPKYQDKIKPDQKERYKAKLKELNVFALEQLIYIKDRKQIITKSHPQYPIFLFDHGTHQKVYKPNEPQKQYRFLYIGDKPKDYINGLSLLAKKQAKKKDDPFEEESSDDRLDEVIICSGERDSLNVHHLGYNVVWLNSETATITKTQYYKLLELAKKVYLLPDIDDTGEREALKTGLEYLDMHIIWLPEALKLKKDWRGNPCNDLTDFMRYYTQYDFKKLFENALPFRFWDIQIRKDHKGDYKKIEYAFNNVQAYNFLYRNGFSRYREAEDSPNFDFVHQNDGIVRKVKDNDVKMFIHNFLEDKMLDIKLRNMVYKTNQLNETSLSNLNYKEFTFNTASKEHQYIFFKNKAIKIDKKNIKEVKFKETNTFVWKESLIDHDFQLEDDYFTVEYNENKQDYDLKIHNKESVFFQYLINVSRVHWRKELEEGIALTADEKQEQDLHIINKMYAIGYLLHSYRDPNNSWCVFAMDNRISDADESHGGSGKSILFNYAIRSMVSDVYKSGRNKDIVKDPHIFDGVSSKVDYIIIDDCHRYLPFDFFFTYVTGDFNVNPKGKQPFAIPYKDSPKIAFTSNYPPSENDGSSRRRILFTVFSDWYHNNDAGEYNEARSPKDDFNMSLFTDFDQKEWNLFYNFALQCLKLYLSFPKIDPPMANVNKRNLLQQMTDHFKSWADIYFENQFNTEVVKLDAFEDFKDKSKLKTWTSNRFTKSLKYWCQYNEYKLNPSELSNKEGRIIKKVDGKAIEYFYVEKTEEIAEKKNEYKLEF